MVGPILPRKHLFSRFLLDHNVRLYTKVYILFHARHILDDIMKSFRQQSFRNPCIITVNFVMFSMVRLKSENITAKDIGLFIMLG